MEVKNSMDISVSGSKNSSLAICSSMLFEKSSFKKYSYS